MTGASGFLGSRLLERLAQRDDAEVRALTRTIPVRLESQQNIVWVQGDLASPSDCRVFAEGLDAIVHLAHVNTPLTSNRELASDASLNLVATLNLLDVLREGGARPHLVYAASGGAVYRPSPDGTPLDESSPLEPRSSYGILKIAVESYLWMAAAEGWLTATALRIGNAYGALLPPERMQGFIGVAMNELANDRPIRVFGNPENVRDYVHVDDVIDAFELALDRRDGYQLYNVGSGLGISVRQLVELLGRITGIPSAVREDHDVVDQAANLPRWVVLDSSRIERQFGWRARVPLEDGLRSMWDGRPR